MILTVYYWLYSGILQNCYVKNLSLYKKRQIFRNTVIILRRLRNAGNFVQVPTVLKEVTT